MNVVENLCIVEQLKKNTKDLFWDGENTAECAKIGNTAFNCCMTRYDIDVRRALPTLDKFILNSLKSCWRVQDTTTCIQLQGTSFHFSLAMWWVFNYTVEPDLRLYVRVPLVSYIVNENSKGSGKTMQMPRLGQQRLWQDHADAQARPAKALARPCRCPGSASKGSGKTM